MDLVLGMGLRPSMDLREFGASAKAQKGRQLLNGQLCEGAIGSIQDGRLSHSAVERAQ
jgi:hypothetical protein